MWGRWLSRISSMNHMTICSSCCSAQRGGRILLLWMVHTGCVLVAPLSEVVASCCYGWCILGVFLLLRSARWSHPVVMDGAYWVCSCCSAQRGGRILLLWMVHTGCVLVAPLSEVVASCCYGWCILGVFLLLRSARWSHPVVMDGAYWVCSCCSAQRGGRILLLWMVHTGCVLVAPLSEVVASCCYGWCILGVFLLLRSARWSHPVVMDGAYWVCSCCSAQRGGRILLLWMVHTGCVLVAPLSEVVASCCYGWCILGVFLLLRSARWSHPVVMDGAYWVCSCCSAQRGGRILLLWMVHTGCVLVAPLSEVVASCCYGWCILGVFLLLRSARWSHPVVMDGAYWVCSCCSAQRGGRILLLWMVHTGCVLVAPLSEVVASCCYGWCILGVFLLLRSARWSHPVVMDGAYWVCSCCSAQRGGRILLLWMVHTGCVLVAPLSEVVASCCYGWCILGVFLLLRSARWSHPVVMDGAYWVCSCCSAQRGGRILLLWMVHTGCVLVAPLSEVVASCCYGWCILGVFLLLRSARWSHPVVMDGAYWVCSCCSAQRGGRILLLWMVHTGCVLVAPLSEVVASCCYGWCILGVFLLLRSARWSHPVVMDGAYWVCSCCSAQRGGRILLLWMVHTGCVLVAPLSEVVASCCYGWCILGVFLLLRSARWSHPVVMDGAYWVCSCCSAQRGGRILLLWMVHTGCVLVAPLSEVVASCCYGWCILGVFLLLAFTHTGQECQDVFSPNDWMHACLVYTSMLAWCTPECLHGVYLHACLVYTYACLVYTSMPAWRTLPCLLGVYLHACLVYTYACLVYTCGVHSCCLVYTCIPAWCTPPCLFGVHLYTCLVYTSMPAWCTPVYLFGVHSMPVWCTPPCLLGVTSMPAWCIPPCPLGYTSMPAWCTPPCPLGVHLNTCVVYTSRALPAELHLNTFGVA